MEFILGEEDVTKTGIYLAEQVEVKISATDNSDMSGTVITINNSEYIWEGTPVTAKVPFDTSYTIKLGYKQGYILSPSNYAFTASQSSRVVDAIYDIIPKDIIIINQTISDPDTMISGAVNNDTIKAIREGSHRYLGKYTSERTMTLCELDDDDSTKFTDGTDADLTGSQGDVFMKMPNFFYRSIDIDEDNIKGLQFRLGTSSPGEDWNEWDTNTLIGVYGSYPDTNDKLYSRSNVSYYNTVNFMDAPDLIGSRGKGFQLIDWQMHCVMALLFYAQYGHTNSQLKIGAGSNFFYQYSTGLTNSCGMNDTAGEAPVTGLNDLEKSGNEEVINFWGLEGWWGTGNYPLDNVSCKDDTIVITELGSQRSYEHISGYTTTKIKLGRYCDIVATRKNSDESYTLGFCDHFFATGNGRAVTCGGYGSGSSSGISYVSTTSSKVSPRIAFRGKCIIEKDVTNFKLLEAIG